MHSNRNSSRFGRVALSSALMAAVLVGVPQAAEAQAAKLPVPQAGSPVTASGTGIGEPSVMPGVPPVAPPVDRPGGLPELPTVPVTPAPPLSDPPVVPERNYWRYILIHHSASPSGNAASFDRMHRSKGWDGVAYHFVITNGKGGADGELQVSKRWWAQKHGAHAGGAPWLLAEERNAYNEFGIGICLVGNFEKSKPSKRQVETLVKLVRKLQTDFNIPHESVMGHRHVKGTACPGRHFPWKTVFARLDLAHPTHLVKHTIYGTQERCPWCWKQTAIAAAKSGNTRPTVISPFTADVPPPTGATVTMPTVGSINPPPR